MCKTSKEYKFLEVPGKKKLDFCQIMIGYKTSFIAKVTLGAPEKDADVWIDTIGNGFFLQIFLERNFKKMNADGHAHAELSYRLADGNDTEAVSAIIMEVSDGIVETLMRGALRFIDAREAVSWVMSHGAGCYRVENVILIEDGGELAGLLFTYPASEHGIPEAVEWYVRRNVREELHDVLLASCPGSLHVNTLWVAPEKRGMGLGAEMLRFAGDLSRRKGLDGVGLFVWADNTRALRFYESLGCRKSRAVPAGNPPVRGKNGPHIEGGFLMFRPPEDV